MAKVFDQHGIYFLYPADWTAEEEVMHDEETGAEEYAVTVFSPQGSFWSIAKHPAADPERLANAVVSTLREEYPDTDVSVVDDQFAGWPVVGYDVSFLCLDLTATAQVRCISTEAASYVIFAQAEDSEFERVGDAWAAMAHSFMSRLIAQASAEAAAEKMQAALDSPGLATAALPVENLQLGQAQGADCGHEPHVHGPGCGHLHHETVEIQFKAPTAEAAPLLPTKKSSRKRPK